LLELQLHQPERLPGYSETFVADLTIKLHKVHRTIAVMATKLAKAGPLGGMHTAGIFSDMTVDGPEIGTLVVIIDRAKNLPNRRTMGKQNPYCACRLGKEAKKTDTDRRGGQTPRW
jgi:hypothetical protein